MNLIKILNKLSNYASRNEKFEARVISQLLGILESNREPQNLGEFDRPMEMLRGNSTNPNDILQATSSKIEEYEVQIEATNPK